MIFYTLTERTEKSKTVGQAVNIALMLLRERHNLNKVCTNALHRGRHRREDDEPITVVELNKLVEDMVNDTTFHEGLWT